MCVDMLEYVYGTKNFIMTISCNPRECDGRVYRVISELCAARLHQVRNVRGIRTVNAEPHVKQAVSGYP